MIHVSEFPIHAVTKKKKKNIQQFVSVHPINELTIHARPEACMDWDLASLDILVGFLI